MRTLKQILQGEELEKFLFDCSINPRKWCERVIQDPKDHSQALSIKDFHMNWFNNFLNRRRAVVLAPRGFGKTTILTVCFSTWISFFRQNQEFVIISKSLHQSKKVLARVKFAIRDNELLRQMIPPKMDLVWTKTEINLKGRNDMYVQPYNDNLRGEHPNWVFADEVSTYKNKTFYYRAITPLLNRRDGHLMAIGTPKTNIDLLAELQRNSEYKCEVYRAIKRDGTALWPEMFPLSRLKAIREEMGAAGFNAEYLCNLVSSEISLYPFEELARCMNPDLGFEDFKEEEVSYVIGGDFAVSKSGDYTVLIVLKILENPRRYQIVEMYRFRGLKPDFIQDKVQELANIYDPSKIILDESTFGVNICEELRSRGLFIDGFKSWSSKRNELLTNLSGIISSAKLIIPRSSKDENVISLTDVLLKELNEFVRTETATGQPTFQGGKNDDSVMALALACRGAKETSKLLVAFESPETLEEYRKNL